MDIAKVIIEAGARYDIKDEHGKTAFDWIENKGTKERYDKIVEDYKLSLEYKPGSKKDVKIQIYINIIYVINEVLKFLQFLYFLFFFFFKRISNFFHYIRLLLLG